MLKSSRVFNTIERILKISFDHWEYTVEGRMSHAIVHQRGWRAELWYRPYVNDCDNSPAPNHEAFLRSCRTRSSVFKIDVEVEGDSLVGSANRKGPANPLSEARPMGNSLFRASVAQKQTIGLLLRSAQPLRTLNHHVTPPPPPLVETGGHGAPDIQRVFKGDADRRRSVTSIKRPI